LIDAASMEGAMDFLAETDIRFAETKTRLMQTEILCKRVRARVFVNEEGAIELRKAKAEANGDVVDADKDYVAAMLDFETLKARRSRAEIVIDVWRTLEASRRKT
jgi:hypothetical protein